MLSTRIYWICFIIISLMSISFPTIQPLEIEDGEAARSIFSSESVPTRSMNKVVTAYEPDLSDFVYVPYEENLVQREEGYVKLDDRIASGTRKLTASTDSTYGMSSSRMAQSYKDKLYVCYVTAETSGGGHRLCLVQGNQPERHEPAFVSRPGGEIVHRRGCQ